MNDFTINITTKDRSITCTDRQFALRWPDLFTSNQLLNTDCSCCEVQYYDPQAKLFQYYWKVCGWCKLLSELGLQRPIKLINDRCKQTITIQEIR